MNNFETINIRVEKKLYDIVKEWLVISEIINSCKESRKLTLQNKRCSLTPFSTGMQRFLKKYQDFFKVKIYHRNLLGVLLRAKETFYKPDSVIFNKFQRLVDLLYIAKFFELEEKFLKLEEKQLLQRK